MMAPPGCVFGVQLDHRQTQALFITYTIILSYWLMPQCGVEPRTFIWIEDRKFNENDTLKLRQSGTLKQAV